MKQSIVHFILCLVFALLKVTHPFPSPQLLPPVPVANLASPITNTIKKVPKIVNDLTGGDKHVQLNFGLKFGKTGTQTEAETLTTTTITTTTTTTPTTISSNVPLPVSAVATNEIYSNSTTEKITTEIPPMQIINQANATNVLPLNRTNSEQHTEISPNEKGTTDAISVKSTTPNTTDVSGHIEDPFNMMELTDGFSNDVQSQETSVRGLDEFGQHTVYYNHHPVSQSSAPDHYNNNTQITNINTNPLINKDGSVPVNSPTHYVVHVYELAEKELENHIKTDGFYRNLIFAEHLFSKDNDEIALNNAVINVNVYTRQEKASGSGTKTSGKEKEGNNDGGGGDDEDNRERGRAKEPGVFVEHVKPGKIEITIDNEYPVEKMNEKINDKDIDVTTANVTLSAPTTSDGTT